MKIILLISLISLSCCLNWVQFKTCDTEWGDDRLWVDDIKGTDYTFCTDESIGRDPTFFDAKLMTLTADGLFSRAIKCGDAPCTPGNLNKLIIRVGKDGFMKATGVVSADGTSRTVNVLDYLPNHILINSYLDKDGKAFFFVVTGLKDKDTLTGINHDGENVEVALADIVDYMGWKVLNASENLKFLEQ